MPATFAHNIYLRRNTRGGVIVVHTWHTPTSTFSALRVFPDPTRAKAYAARLRQDLTPPKDPR